MFLSKSQARESSGFRKMKASIMLRWIHAGHPATNLRLYSAIRSLGLSSDKNNRPRNVAEFRRDWQPISFDSRARNR